MEPDIPMHVMQYISDTIRENYEIKYGENLLNLYNEGHHREFIELTFLSCSTYRKRLEKIMPPWLIRKLYIKYSDHFDGQRRQINRGPSSSGNIHNFQYAPRPLPSAPNPFCSGLNYMPAPNHSTPAAQVVQTSPFQNRGAHNLLDNQRSWSPSGEECFTTSKDLEPKISSVAAPSSRVSLATNCVQQDTHYVVTELVNNVNGAIVKCGDLDGLVIPEVPDFSNRPKSPASSGCQSVVSLDCENYSTLLTSTTHSDSGNILPVLAKCENDITINSSTCSSSRSSGETSIYYPINKTFHSNDESGANPNFECIDMDDQQPLPTNVSLVPNYALGSFGQIAASQGEYTCKISDSPPPLRSLVPKPEPAGPSNLCYADPFHNLPDPTGRELSLRYEPFQPNAPPSALKPSKLRSLVGKDFTTLDFGEAKHFELKLESSLPSNLKLPGELHRAENLPANGHYTFGQSGLGGINAPLFFHYPTARGPVSSSMLSKPFPRQLVTTLSPVTYVMPSGSSKDGGGFKLWIGGRGVEREREGSCRFAESQTHIVFSATTPLKRSDLRGGMSGAGRPSPLHQLTTPQSPRPVRLLSTAPKTKLARHIVPRSSSLKWKRRALILIDSLYIIPGIDAFCHPLKPAHAPGYSDVVRYPMDYTTLRKRVTSGLVCEDGQLFQQILLIHMNAMMFNSEDHPVYQVNQRVWVQVNARIKSYLLTLLITSDSDDDEDE